MNAPLQIRSIRIHRLAIPMRVRFEHAAAVRDTADPLIIEMSAGAPYAHHVAYGETLARPYVTGETPDSVVEDIAAVFAPRLEAFRPTTFVEALEFLDTLPTQVAGRVLTAARAGIELALLDLACHAFRRRPTDIAGWMDLPGFGPPGCRTTARYSGMVLGRSRRKLSWMLRLQLLYGLRDFKLKVGVEGWEQRLEWAYAILKRRLGRQRATLRADANGAWLLADATDASTALEQHGVSALEQPLSDAQDTDLPYLAERTSCDLIADESLLTVDDAQRLIAAGGIKVFNVRIAKNGGLMPALRIARLALAAGLDVQLGCLVGETSLLAAAGVAFLESCPKVRFVEGAYGPWLLRTDVTTRPVRFGYGGRIGELPGLGLGVQVDPARLNELAAGRPRTLPL